jgi:hypothetical protein
MMRLLKALTLVCWIALAAAPVTAAADGLPIDGIDAGSTGVTTPSGELRHVTLASGAGTTIVVSVRRGSGQIAHYSVLRGPWTIPAVGLDGSPSGLSADGRTLVLIKPRPGFPRARTPLSVLSTRSLRRRAVVDLRGDFSFDAISPDGRRAYLIHYTSRRDITRYEVRALDLRSGRLLPGAIADPNEEPGEMRGLPVTRSTSPDGRWAYTLYDGAEHPFVHALDTVGSRAVCIDLDALEHRKDIAGLRLASTDDAAGLDVLSPRRRPLAHIDTATFAVSAPAQAVSGGSGFPVTALLIVAAALLCGVTAWALRRRFGGLTSERSRTVKGS